MSEWSRNRRFVCWAAGGVLTMLLLVALPIWFVGCDALNPSFVAMVSSATSSGSDTSSVGNRSIQNATGHVPIMFVNNTTFDNQILNYLEDLGVDTTSEDLRPRIRMRVRVEFVNDNVIVFEFQDGSDLIQPTVQIQGTSQVNTSIPPDLLEPPLTNQVFVCDVRSVEIQASSIEVFVPVYLKEIMITDGDNTIPVRELQSTYQPQFRALQQDEVDANYNIVLQRNLGIRDTPAPVQNITCGAVVGFVLEGTLSVPFVQDENGETVPGFLDTDTQSQAQIPGRYTIRTTVQ